MGRPDPIVYLSILCLVASLVWAMLGHVWIVEGGAACRPSNTRPLKDVYLALFFCGFVIVYSAAWFYDLSYMEQDDVLTLRSAAGVPEERGFHKAPPPPPVDETSNSETHGLLSGWFGRGHRAENATAAQQTNVHEAPEPQKKGKCRLAIKLAFSLFLDMLGNATYCIPSVGEVGDMVFAPASAVMLKMLYNKNGIAGIGFAEEILPFTDITPTATIAFVMENVMAKDNCMRKCFGFTKDD